MTVESKEYNPLDYENLTRNCVEELMKREAHALPPDKFSGAGVYALFYRGPLNLYRPVCSPDSSWPIYVGKAVRAGARKGKSSGKKGTELFDRLRQHARSIEHVDNLNLADFRCRFLVVTPLWITMAERFLVEHYQPLWNVHLDGFGNHNPGKGRHKGEITWWDALHEGRPWAAALSKTRTRPDAEQRVVAYLTSYKQEPRSVDFDQIAEAAPPEYEE